MNKVTLVYFEGCPEAKNVRAALLNAGIFDFEVVKQDGLQPNDPLKKLSSPSVLWGEELVYGIRIGGEVASCTFDYKNFIDDESLVERFKELKSRNIQRKKSSRPLIGTAFSVLVVLKCPICIPGLAGFLSALGLGFLISATVLKSLLIFLLLITLSGFLFSYIKRHQNPFPLAFSILFSITLFVTRFYFLGSSSSQIIMYASVVGLIGITLWDLLLKTQSNSNCSAC